MTKKDFEAIAVALRDGRDALMAVTLGQHGHPDSINGRSVQRIHASTCGTIANTLKTQNARFNRAKFLAACGVSPANTI